MNILVWSRVFHPMPGGVSSVAESLNEQFVTAGHGVRVLTWTRAEEYGLAARDYGYPVERMPGFAAQVRAARWADVVLVHYPSVRVLPVLAVAPRPMVVAMHSWLAPGWRGRAQRATLRLGFPVAISRAVAANVRLPCTRIPSPYRADTFRPRPDLPRDKEVAFCGLLKPFKGGGVLLRAAALLRDRGRPVRVTFVGGATAAEEAALRQQAADLGLADRVTLTGMVDREAAAAELCRHRVAALPPTWEEPFGITALEALGCGCRLVVSRSGGLPEAAGGCGPVVPKDDPAALADAVAAELDKPAALGPSERAARAAHLHAHSAAEVARRYLLALAAARRAGPFRGGVAPEAE